ncbi:peptidase M14, carboxypeptidase A [Magnetococcus marinus MC-1]|uniref:Peptidase M14, carboxypeptidase A n=1 Tax=Magnetococcus marinus (strain ATCC BAA-1437 / JCM 17883 / MC-1) TaxID=156889 RepID=A0L3M9_MAGMM|nr:M14 family murein peptide amidase A [Magnetococcus marinus]ABK42572.1 peptidase M14, carboxypeptidase A [Magnetococcus marinus MC-1]
MTHAQHWWALPLALVFFLGCPPVQAGDTGALSPLLSMEQTCQRIGNKLGSVSVQDCLSQELRPTGGYSVGGIPILVKEYPPLGQRLPRGRILVLGGIHGDEYSSVSITFRWLEKLNLYHSGLFHWRVAPLTNPDGLLQENSVRMNAHGVDLNRNFGTPDWADKALEYWEKDTLRDPRRYPGPAPLSEPESRWIAQEIESFKPDVIVSIHAPYGLLDFDGPPKNPPKRLGSLYLSPLGTYPGSLGRYAGMYKKIPIITIELKYAGIMPSNSEIRNIWMDLVRWLSRNVNPATRQVGVDHDPDQDTNHAIPREASHS